MVLLQPISALFPIITAPICGYLIFNFLPGKKPKPFFPIIAPSSMFVLFPIKQFLLLGITNIAVIYLNISLNCVL